MYCAAFHSPFSSLSFLLTYHREKLRVGVYFKWFTLHCQQDSRNGQGEFASLTVQLWLYFLRLPTTRNCSEVISTSDKAKLFAKFVRWWRLTPLLDYPPPPRRLIEKNLGNNFYSGLGGLKTFQRLPVQIKCLRLSLRILTRNHPRS